MGIISEWKNTPLSLNVLLKPDEQRADTHLIQHLTLFPSQSGSRALTPALPASHSPLGVDFQRETNRESEAGGAAEAAPGSAHHTLTQPKASEQAWRSQTFVRKGQEAAA